jgi:hypothetical protein
MSDIPADKGPAPDDDESARGFLADALSPVVDPDFVRDAAPEEKKTRDPSEEPSS